MEGSAVNVPIILLNTVSLPVLARSAAFFRVVYSSMYVLQRRSVTWRCGRTFVRRHPKNCEGCLVQVSRHRCIESREVVNSFSKPHVRELEDWHVARCELHVPLAVLLG